MDVSGALPAGLVPVELAAASPAERLALSQEAGWNQTDSDWARLLARGYGFGLAERGGALVASAILLPYDEAIAWISMVLVTQRWRRRGLASRLMHLALQQAAALGRTTFLDATADGAPVYRALGFVEAARFTRWHRPGATGAAPADPPAAGKAAEEADAGVAWAAVVERDARALGAPRQNLLAALAADGRHVLRPDGSLLFRPGRVAWQLGPLVAERQDAAEALLEQVLEALDGQAVFADARDGCGLEPRLESAGFRAQRGFLRMHRGSPPASDGRLLWLTAGPEFG